VKDQLKSQGRRGARRGGEVLGVVNTGHSSDFFLELGGETGGDSTMVNLPGSVEKLTHWKGLRRLRTCKGQGGCLVLQSREKGAWMHYVAVGEMPGSGRDGRRYSWRRGEIENREQKALNGGGKVIRVLLTTRLIGWGGRGSTKRLHLGGRGGLVGEKRTCFAEKKLTSMLGREMIKGL